MNKIFRKIILFFLFSVLLYFLSYFSFAFNNSFLPNPSFYHLSTLVDKFDFKIQNLNISSLNLKTKQIQDSSTNSIASTLNNSEKNPNDLKYSQTLSLGETNTYFFYLLRIFSRFLLLVYVQLYVFYILLFRYGELFKDLCDLSFKSLKDFNWRSPITFAKSFYCFSCWLSSIFLYYNSLLPLKYRMMVYSTLVFLISLISFRAGLGTKHLLISTPLVLGLTIYFSVLLTFNSKVTGLLSVLDKWLLPLWTFSIFLRGFVLETVDDNTVLELREENENLSHQASCCMDLFLVFVVLNLFKSTPFLGKLFTLNIYLKHLYLFFTMCMVIHCCLVNVSKQILFKGTPFSGVRNLLVYLLDYLMFHLFGIPKFFSNRSRNKVNNLFSKNITRVKYAFNIVFGRLFETLNEHRSFVLIVKCLKSIPQLILLILPPIFSRLYFEYSTLVLPVITSLSHTKNFKEKLFCLSFFLLSELVRNAVNFFNWSSLKTLLRISLIFLLNYTLVLVRKLVGVPK